MNFGQLLSQFRRFGIPRSIFLIFYRLMNRFLYLRILDIMTLDFDDLAAPRMPNKPFLSGFVQQPRLVEITADSSYHMSEAFLERALNKGDKCFGVFRDGRLISYVWYSGNETWISHEMAVSFSPKYVYVYKSLTLDEYRGQGFNGATMYLSLKQFAEQGLAGTVSYVDAANFASLISIRRMGFRRSGRVIVLRWFGRYIIKPFGDYEKYGFELKPIDRSQSFRPAIPMAADEPPHRRRRSG